MKFLSNIFSILICIAFIVSTSLILGSLGFEIVGLLKAEYTTESTQKLILTAVFKAAYLEFICIFILSFCSVVFDIRNELIRR